MDLAGILAARSAEVAEAVTDAIASHVTPSSGWLTAEHLRSERAGLRARWVDRAIVLAGAGQPLAGDDLQFYESLGVLFARHAVPLRLLEAAFDVGTAAIARESWRIAPVGYLAEMPQFTGSAARMAWQGLQASARAYQTASQARGDLRPAGWGLDETLVPAAGPSVGIRQWPATSREGQEVTRLLGELAGVAWMAPRLSSGERHRMLGGIYAITAQLASPAPDQLLVASLWDAVNAAAAVSGAAGMTPLTRQITQLLARLAG